MNRSQPPAGTTLIELMVALGVLSLMAVLLLGGMRLGLKVWESGGDHQVYEQRLERTDAFLRQLISQAGRAAPAAGMPLGGDATGASQALVKTGFLGETDRLRFVAQLPYQLGSDGDYEFELARHATGDGGNLVLGWRRTAGPPAGADPANQTILLSDVRSLRVAYFGHLTNEPWSAWHDSWSDSAGLPAMIRLDLSLVAAQQPVRVTLFYGLRFSNSGL